MNVDTLKNIIRIIREGKKPIKQSIFLSDRSGLFEFQGQQYDLDGLHEVLKDYESIHHDHFVMLIRNRHDC